MEPPWYNRKPERTPGIENQVVISRDLGKKGAKSFALVTDVQEMVRFFEANRGGSYYEVLEHTDKPCWWYMDIDCALQEGETGQDLDAEGRRMAEAVLKMLSEFLQTHHSIPLELGLGREGVEVASASTPAKLSLHVVCHIRMASIALLKVAVSKFQEYLRERGHPAIADAIDLSVYGNFRSYRTLGMKKEGKDNALRAVGGSRDSVRHHLVGWYPELALPSIAEISHIPYRLEDGPKIRSSRTPVEAPHSLAVRGFGEIPTGFYRTVATAITSSRELKEVLFASSGANPARDVIVDDFVELKDGSAIYHISRRCSPRCPYAGRVHKKNRMYLYFDRVKSTLTLRCHDDACEKTPVSSLKSFVYEDTHEEMLRVHSDTCRDTLHTHADSIPWTEDYTSETMQPYPLVSQLAVRSNMGVGKTEELKRFLREQLEKRGHATVLFVTFSQALARKYAEELEGAIGLECYLKHAHRSTLNQSRLVVCLDSLYRYELSSVDYLVIDECTSVLNHLRSDVMQRPSECLGKLELLLLRSKHVVYLDAAIDNAISFRVIRHFEQLRNDKVTWVWNRYVRPTNRTARIVVENRGENVMQRMALQLILRKLEEGERVVIPTSTRAFAKQVAVVIQDRFPEKRLRVYHSEVDRKQLEEDLRDVGTAWQGLDALVYSPTVSAGTSYVGENFDSLVGFFNVGPTAPTVDLVLQMLFRVRKLRKGGMDIFVEKSCAFENLPITESAVDYHLDTSIAMYSKLGLPEFHAHTNLSEGGQIWDKDRISYTILRHLVSSSNRSHRYFTDILLRTLRDDYNITTVVKTTEDAPCDTDELLVLPKGVKAPTWRPEFIPNNENANLWMNYKESDLDVMMKAFEAVHKTTRALKADAHLVNEHFYNNYVINSAVKPARCLRYILETRYQDNLQRMQDKIVSIQQTDDPNLEMYRWAIKKRYILQLLCQQYFETVLTEEDLERLKRLEDVTPSRKKTAEFVDSTLSSLTEMEKKSLFMMLGYKGTTPVDGKKALHIINSILRNTVGLSIDPSKTKEPRAPAYDKLRLSLKRWRDLVQDYGSTFFRPDDDGEEDEVDEG